MTADARSLQGRDPIRLFAGVRAVRAGFPSAALLIDVAPQPVNDGRPPNTERAGNLGIIPALF